MIKDHSLSREKKTPARDGLQPISRDTDNKDKVKSSEAMMILVVMNAILANAYIRSRSLKNSGQSPENMEDIIKDSEIFGIQKLSSHQEDAIKYVAA